jgi:hypothetical protein
MVLVSLSNTSTAKEVEAGLVYERGAVASVEQKSQPIERYLTIAIILVVLFLWYYFR